jgi:uncharacterized iron-regulated membrane protein
MTTTNTGRWLAGGLAALALGGLAWANRRLFLVHDITTGESAAYPELRSRVYYADPGAVLRATEQAIRALPRWQVTQVDAPDHALDAEVAAAFGRTDDVTVYVQTLGGGQARAVLRARARVGAGDMGRSAAHIRALQDAMDSRLTRDAAF